MTLTRKDRKTLKDIIAKIEAGDIDAAALSLKLDRIEREEIGLDNLLTEAAFQVQDIEEADEDDMEDYCREAVKAIEAVLEYRKTPVRKAKNATGPAGIEVVMIDETTGWLCL